MLAKPAAPLPLVVETLLLGLVERPAGHVVNPQMRFVGARLLDQARPLPGDAWVGVLLIDVFHEQVFALRHHDFRRPLRLARHGKYRADEDAGVWLRLEGLDGDRLPPARLHREAHAVGLGGDVHVGVGDEHVHGVARPEPPHRHVPRPPHAIVLLELHERGRNRGVGERCCEESLLRRLLLCDHRRILVEDRELVAGDDLEHVILGEVEEALFRRQHLLPLGVDESDGVDRRRIGLEIGDQEPHDPGPGALAEGHLDRGAVGIRRDLGGGRGEGVGERRMLLDRKHVLRDRRGERRLRGVDEHLEFERVVLIGIHVDVDPVHALGEGPLDLEGALRGGRHLAVDREDILVVVRIALGIERERPRLRLVDLEARDPVADVIIRIDLHRSG